MKSILKRIFIIAVLATGSGAVFAEYQLHEGSDSTTIDVEVTIPKMVTITKPTDMPLMYFTGKGDLEATSHFCIASNLETPNVKLEVTNGQPGSHYHLNQKLSANPFYGKSADRKLGFTVYYQDNSGVEVPINNNAGASVAGSKWLSDCKAAPFSGSTLKVRIKEANAQHVFTGIYTSTLTLTVSPE